MSIRSVGRRQARQAKSRGKWDSLSHKKGQVPARTQPSNNLERAIMKPSRRGLETPSA